METWNGFTFDWNSHTISMLTSYLNIIQSISNILLIKCINNLAIKLTYIVQQLSNYIFFALILRYSNNLGINFLKESLS